MKLKAVRYGRKFSSENRNPEAQLSKYEPEEIVIEFEPTEDTETPNDLFNAAYNEVQKLKKHADKRRNDYLEVDDIKRDLKTIEMELDNASDMTLLKLEQAEKIKALRELGVDVSEYESND